MDKINENWLIRTDELASELEKGYITIDRLSDDQLVWLIYYNWGYSGAYIMPETQLAEAELINRGNPYNWEYAERLVELTEEYY